MSLRARPTLEARVHRRLQRKAAHSRLTSSVSRDPKTGKVRLGKIVVTFLPACRCHDDECGMHIGQRSCGLRLIQYPVFVSLALPKRLESPNRWLWTHWRTKSAAKKAWATLITRTTAEQIGRLSIADLTSPARALGWSAPTSRARVEITRHFVRGHAITDRDNLTFAGKGLLDCLVQTGFLVDDSTDHIDLHVTQVPSADGLDLTVVTIAPIPAAPGAPHADR